MIDAHEQAVIDRIIAAQQGVDDVHNEIAVVAAVITRGRVPEYRKPTLLRFVNDEPLDAA